VGWLFGGFWSYPHFQRYIPDLIADPWLVKVDRSYYVFVVLSLALPTAIGAWIEPTWRGALMGLLWGGLARIFMTHHITWSINSVCHIFGRRDYDSQDHSRNNWLCGILAFGEGWHNNHHAFPTSARHGLKWWQFDASWLIIRAMQSVGLAWNVQLPSGAAIQKKALR
jgi:stearoyl-CoA desaturase (delta-9 desaturase)